jgi:hypothetical protein
VAPIEPIGLKSHPNASLDYSTSILQENADAIYFRRPQSGLFIRID